MDKETESGFKVALNDSQRHTAKNKDNKAEQRQLNTSAQPIQVISSSSISAEAWRPPTRFHQVSRDKDNSKRCRTGRR